MGVLFSLEELKTTTGYIWPEYNTMQLMVTFRDFFRSVYK